MVEKLAKCNDPIMPAYLEAEIANKFNLLMSTSQIFLGGVPPDPLEGECYACCMYFTHQWLRIRHTQLKVPSSFYGGYMADVFYDHDLLVATMITTCNPNEYIRIFG